MIISILYFGPSEIRFFFLCCFYASPVWLSILFYWYYAKTVTIAHWHHSMDNFAFPPKQFYDLVKASVDARGLQGITYKEITHFENGVLGTRREYLRITCDNYRFDVCAAPFARGYYVSWYLAVRKGAISEFLKKWKFFAEVLEMKTYYQFDTDIMFKEMMHSALTEAVDAMTNEQGQRLTDIQRKAVHQGGKLELA